MIADRDDQSALLFGRHDAGLDVLLQSEYATGTLQNREDRVISRDGSVVVGRDGTHRGFCATAAHGPDRSDLLTETFLPESAIGVEHDFRNVEISKCR
jgi:hypothetical protein